MSEKQITAGETSRTNITDIIDIFVLHILMHLAQFNGVKIFATVFVTKIHIFTMELLVALQLFVRRERHGAYRTLKVIFDNFAETLRNVFGVTLLLEEDLLATLANWQGVRTFRLHFSARKIERLILRSFRHLFFDVYLRFKFCR